MLKFFYLLAGILTLLNGAWMLFFPEAWYRDFPAGIPHTGPFNSHFIRDLGVAFIVIALAFAWCARYLNRSFPVHLGLTVFFTGHALIHVVELEVGRLPHSHWLIDTPGVFVPAVIMIILAVPSVRRRLVR